LSSNIHYRNEHSVMGSKKRKAGSEDLNLP